MEVNFMQQEIFLIYLTTFLLFFLSGMLAVIALQLNQSLRQVTSERDELLKLLGRQIPEEVELPDKNDVLIGILQERISQLKEVSAKVNVEISRRASVLVTESPKQMHRKIFIEKALDLE